MNTTQSSVEHTQVALQLRDREEELRAALAERDAAREELRARDAELRAANADAQVLRWDAQVPAEGCVRACSGVLAGKTSSIAPNFVSDVGVVSSFKSIKVLSAFPIQLSKEIPASYGIFPRSCSDAAFVIFDLRGAAGRGLEVRGAEGAAHERAGARERARTRRRGARGRGPPGPSGPRAPGGALCPAHGAAASRNAAAALMAFGWTCGQQK